MSVFFERNQTRKKLLTAPNTAVPVERYTLVSSTRVLQQYCRTSTYHIYSKSKQRPKKATSVEHVPEEGEQETKSGCSPARRGCYIWYLVRE